MVGWGVMGATVLWKKLLDQASVAIYLILNGKGTNRLCPTQVANLFVKTASIYCVRLWEDVPTDRCAIFTTKTKQYSLHTTLRHSDRKLALNTFVATQSPK